MLSVLGMILDMLERGLLPRVKRFVEGTSGNTGLALLAYAHCIGVPEVLLVIQRDLAIGKKDPLELAGAEFIYPMDGMSAIATARLLGGGGYSPDDHWGLPTMAPSVSTNTATSTTKISTSGIPDRESSKRCRTFGSMPEASERENYARHREVHAATHL